MYFLKKLGLDSRTLQWQSRAVSLPRCAFQTCTKWLERFFHCAFSFQWKTEILDYCHNTRVLLIGCKIDLRTDFSTLMELSHQKQAPVSYEQVRQYRMLVLVWISIAILSFNPSWNIRLPHFQTYSSFPFFSSSSFPKMTKIVSGMLDLRLAYANELVIFHLQILLCYWKCLQWSIISIRI